MAENLPAIYYCYRWDIYSVLICTSQPTKRTTTEAETKRNISLKARFHPVLGGRQEGGRTFAVPCFPLWGPRQRAERVLGLLIGWRGFGGLCALGSGGCVLLRSWGGRRLVGGPF